MNPLFESYQKNNAASNPFGFPDLKTALNDFAAQVRQVGMTPEQIVRQKIMNREISQEQFEQFGKMADAIAGRMNGGGR